MEPKTSRGNQWLVKSYAGLVRYIAANLFPHGYRWYVTGVIPEGKDPQRTDNSILDRYDLRITKWERARRRKVGWAGVRYLRVGRFFVIIATDDGDHPFLAEEDDAIKDAREEPIRINGYSLSVRMQMAGGGKGLWRPSIRIDRKVYLKLKARFLELAVHRTEKSLRRAFKTVPFEPYEPVLRQLYSILRAVNRKRKQARASQLGYNVIRTYMNPVKVFADHDDDTLPEAA